MSSSKSLIYIKNKIGPSTDPCGTPLKTDFQFETSPSPSCNVLAQPTDGTLANMGYQLNTVTYQIII